MMCRNPCITSNKLSAAQDIGVPKEDVIQAVSDGLNDRGVGVTVQWDYDVPGFPNSTSCDTKYVTPAILMHPSISVVFADPHCL